MADTPRKVGLIGKAWWYFKTSTKLKLASGILGLAGLGLQFVVLPTIMSNVATTFLSEKLGIDAQFRDWTFNWLQAEAVAEDVLIKAKSSTDPIIEIRKILFDFNALELYTSKGWRQSLVRIDIESPSLKLYRDKNDRWNWESLIDRESFVDSLGGVKQSPPSSDIRTASFEQSGFKGNRAETKVAIPVGKIKLDELTITGMRVDIEKDNADFSSGSVRTKTSSVIDIQDVNVIVANFTWPLSERTSSQRATFSGQIGGGELSFSLDGPLLNWVQRSESTRFGEVRDATWVPDVIGRATIEGVGIDSLTHLVPQPNVFAREGKLNGKAKISLDPNLNMTFDGLFYLDRVQYVLSDEQANGRMGSSNIFEVNGEGETKFDGRLNQDSFKPFAFMVTSLTEDVLKRNGAGRKLLLAAAKQTNSYQTGLSPEAVKTVQASRPEPLQAALAALAGVVVAKKLEDDLGATNSTKLGISTSETISSSRADKKAKKRKGTIVGNYWRKTFGKKDKN